MITQCLLGIDHELHAMGLLNNYDGFNDGFNSGETKGRDTTIVTTIRNLMETSGWDARQTMNAMKIPASEQEKYAKQL